jgi:hypothetical protein
VTSRAQVCFRVLRKPGLPQGTRPRKVETLCLHFRHPQQSSAFPRAQGSAGLAHTLSRHPSRMQVLGLRAVYMPPPCHLTSSAVAKAMRTIHATETPAATSLGMGQGTHGDPWRRSASVLLVAWVKKTRLAKQYDFV